MVFAVVACGRKNSEKVVVKEVEIPFTQLASCLSTNKDYSIRVFESSADRSKVFLMQKVFVSEQKKFEWHTPPEFVEKVEREKENSLKITFAPPQQDLQSTSERKIFDLDLGTKSGELRSSQPSDDVIRFSCQTNS